MKKSSFAHWALIAAGLAAAAMSGGCEAIKGALEELNELSLETKGSPPQQPQAVPAPINLLLPRKIRIHPFTGTRTFGEAGGVQGIDVRIEVRDAFDDPQKAFGDFRFELYSYRAHHPDPKAKRIAVWKESLMEAKKNLTHWDTIAKRYQFKLQWQQPIPIGQRFVLVATFSSPFTERLHHEQVFVSGE
ncbi:MAG: hypothetical protein ACYTF6_03950 [Planctomycetota bacterium]